jgi:DNA processing protein
VTGGGSGGPSGAEREAAIALACLVEPATPGVTEMVAEFGVEEALARVRATRPSRQVAGRVDPEDTPALVDQMSRRGVRVLLPGDLEFPSQLLDLSEPPLALWVRGPLDLRVAALRSVAVVGARACTAYGERATAILAGGLAEQGWAVVSGGAFGIDAAAHRAALGVGGPTIAVMACGIDIAYPRSHDALFARIADAGLMISELPPGSQPLKHRFLARNRVIAALSRGTVVVEAARRSGAMATASRALELGREVMAVPGPITSMASSGTNRLLHEMAARAVSEPSEVTALLLADAINPPASEPHAQVGVGSAISDPRLAGLPAEVRAVLEVLPGRGGRTVEVIAERARLAPTVCLAHLGLLEIVGLARRGHSGWRRMQ